jgi:putative ABC transport system permease protein
MNTKAQSWVTAARIARRDLRGGLRGFRIFLACLALGVFTIAALGSLTAMLHAGISEEGRAILGGDVEFALVQRRASDAEREALDALGAVSEIATLRAMARTEADITPALIEIKAVDSLYPLVETAITTDGSDLTGALEPVDNVYGVVVDDTLLPRLNVAIGDTVRVGTLDVIIRGTVQIEPDRLGSGFIVGPRLFMTLDALADTGLVQPGSLVRWRYRLDLGDPVASRETVRDLIEQNREDMSEAGWRIRSRAHAAPGVQRFIERLSFFMTLAGLTALIVGGVGIANAVRNYLETRTSTIATLKCLGASGAMIFRIYLLQVMMLAGLATALSLTVGALLPVAATALLDTLLPVPVSPGIYWKPLAIAATFGILVTLAFTIWPLGRARDIPGAVLFRSIVAPVSSWPPLRYLVAISISIATAIIVAFAWYSDTRITAFYIAGTLGSFILLWLLSRGLMGFVRRFVRGSSPQSRLAFRNIHRPGTPAPSIILSLGLGLALIVTLALIDSNMARELRANLPDRAPSFFFLDIQSDQVEPFRATVAETSAGAEVELVPMLRGRIIDIAGTPASEVDAPAEIRWVLRGDRGLTYADALPEGSRLVEGTWWESDYDGPPLVSVEAEIARGLGLDLDDEVTVNVLGRELTARVANLRSVEWESLGINFVMVFSPSALRSAPHTHLATVTTQSETEEPLLRSVNGTYPNITAIRVKEALDAIGALLQKLLAGIRGASAISLLMSILVLAGALASGYQARMYDAAILKTLGASRRDVLTGHLIEYATYGVVTSLFALLAGTIAAYAVIRFVMDLSWSFAPLVALSTVVGAVITTVLLGLATSWGTLGAKPARILRSI